ncbi:MAG: hypothetical protein KA004_04715 [Verrucomicrobiales bacterium]|nr:hypothetical protein [Verrucomicrobiales bacterium]
MKCLPAVWWILLGKTWAGLVANPSFESSYNPSWPHYGLLDAWVPTGQFGVNQSDGPFHNPGTPVPDQARVAFKQGSGTLTQTVSGLTNGQRYWVQFYYDARNCCGGAINIETQINGTTLDTVTNVLPSTGGAPYKFRCVPFVASGASAEIKFATTASGDASVVLDAVCLAARDEGQLVVRNPGFEASGDVAGSGIMPAFAGWQVSGVCGINTSGSGTFANNGTAPDQNHAAFIQGAGSLTQVVENLTPGSSCQLQVAVNARSGNLPHFRAMVDGNAAIDADVAPVGGANPYTVLSANFIPAGSSITLVFQQTAAGDQTLLLDDVKIAGAPAPPCLTLLPAVQEIAPGQSAILNVTVSAQKLLGGPAAITIRSPNQTVAALAGADGDGVATLLFPQSSEDVSLPLEVVGIAPGSVTLEVLDSAGLCVAAPPAFLVERSFVRNPSFENAPAAGGLGTGPIQAWNGGSGLNVVGQPFLDNGAVPDRSQVAFLQGDRILSQQIFGLVPGQNYWLQFRCNSRACCGPRTANLSVKLGGVTLATLTDIPAVGGAQPFLFNNIPFTATAASAMLEFQPNPVGDVTVLLDAVSIVQRSGLDLVLENPSFEASARVSTYPGYLGPQPISGWIAAGGYGLNANDPEGVVGPFTDNGIAPDQDTVLFIQNDGSIRQSVSGLIPGQKYTVKLAVNARNCCGPGQGTTAVRVSYAGTTVGEAVIEPVGGLNPYHEKLFVFTAGAASGELVITHLPTPGNDSTLLLDDVHVLIGDATLPSGIPIAITTPLPGIARIAWPAGAPADLRLQQSVDLAQWTDVETPPYQENGENIVVDVITLSRRFYRLVKP